MKFTAQQIADFLSGEVIGNKDITVDNISKIEEGKPGTLTFLSNPKYTHFIYETKADIVLIDDSFVAEHTVAATLIKVKNAYESLAKLLALVDSVKPKKSGIDPTAVIPESATIGSDCYIGAYVVLGENVKIGNNCRLFPHTFVGDNAVVGDDCLFNARVTLYEGTVVGKRCIIHSGAVIGADGFGFAPDEAGHYQKIPQIGHVVLHDDVEVGANATIDRATMGATVVNVGVKVDNLVQLAHNVEIGEHTVIAAQTGIAGSTKIGKHCVVGGQVGFAGHITIADGSKFGAQAGVTSSIKEENKAWQGSPAIPYNTFYRSNVIFRKLPEWAIRVDALEKKLK